MIIFLDVMPKHIKIKAYELNSVGFNNFNGILIFYMGYEQLLYVSIKNLGPISQEPVFSLFCYLVALACQKVADRWSVALNMLFTFTFIIRTCFI